MGGEIKDVDDADKQREELFALYRSSILEVQPADRQDAYKTISESYIRFLNSVPPSSRLDHIIAEVIKRSAQTEAKLWQPGQTAEVLRHMESYALNLWDYPWKTEFHTITMFSGFFKIKIENKICHPDDILLLLGYKKVVHCFQLLQMPTREEVGRIAFHLFLASLECTEMEKVANAVKPIGIGSRLVHDVRQEVRGDGRLCADQVRERFRLSRTGQPRGGKSVAAPSQSQAATRADAAELNREPVEGRGLAEKMASTPKFTELSRNNERRSSSGGTAGFGEGRTALNEGVGAEFKAHPVSEFKTLPVSEFKAHPVSEFKALPEESKAAVGSGGSASGKHTWQVTADIVANPPVTEFAENVYDAVEDIRMGESVYYGFPSVENGNRKPTKNEKKEPIPPRVTSSGSSLWNQGAAAAAVAETSGSNLSFSTFRQEKSKSGGTASRKTDYRTIDSCRQDRHEGGAQKLVTSEVPLRGRGVGLPMRGQEGHGAENAGYDTAPSHPHRGFGTVPVDRLGGDRDAMTALLQLDPEQMKDKTIRRQVMVQLDPTGSHRPNFARTPTAGRASGLHDTSPSPYQPWQFQPSDHLRSPMSAYKDLQPMRQSPGGGVGGVGGCGKPKGGWKSEDLCQDGMTWQCGSCSYENSLADDACHKCNTSRYL